MLNGQLKPAYNVRIAVENYFIVHGYVSNDRTDYHTLIPVLEKHRKTFGNTLEAVTAAKQKRICRSAAYYLLCHGYGTGQACRFDVIGILGENIIHLENAFMYHA